MRFSLTRFFAATLSVAGLVSTASLLARAQEAPAGSVPAPETKPAPAPETKPTQAGINPDAKKALDDMVAAYQGLKSFSAKRTFTMERGGTRQESVATFSFALPNKVTITNTPAAAEGQAPVTRTVTSDGQFVYTLTSDNTRKYTKEEALPNAGNIQRVLGISGGAGTGLFGLLIANKDAASLVLGPDAATVEFAPDETLDGVETRVVKAVLAPKGQRPAVNLSFAIAKTDNLLRRLTVSMEAPGGGGTALSEVYTAVQANPELAPQTFAFTPPPGAKAEEPKDEEQMFDPRLKVGAAPLPLSGKDLSGKPIRLDAYKGKVVLIDFWATWCGPCVGEMPNVVATYNKYHSKGFEIIGVSLDEAGDREKLVAFTKQNKMPWAQIYDGKGWESALAAAYGVRAIPFTVLIGRNGKIAAVNSRGKELEAAVKAALAKP